jgi:hypothetical protein
MDDEQLNQLAKIMAKFQGDVTATGASMAAALAPVFEGLSQAARQALETVAAQPYARGGLAMGPGKATEKELRELREMGQAEFQRLYQQEPKPDNQGVAGVMAKYAERKGMQDLDNSQLKQALTGYSIWPINDAKHLGFRAGGVPTIKASRWRERMITKPMHVQWMGTHQGHMANVPDDILDLLRQSGLPLTIATVNSTLERCINLDDFRITVAQVAAWCENRGIPYEVFRDGLFNLAREARGSEWQVLKRLPDDVSVYGECDAVRVSIHGMNQIKPGELEGLLELLGVGNALPEYEPFTVWVSQLTGLEVPRLELEFMEGSDPETSPGLFLAGPHLGGYWEVARPVRLDSRDSRARLAWDIRYWVLSERDVIPCDRAEHQRFLGAMPLGGRMVARTDILYRGPEGEFRTALITLFSGVWIPGTEPGSGLFQSRLIPLDGDGNALVSTRPLRYVVLKASTWAQAVVGHAFTVATINKEVQQYGDNETQGQHQFPKEPPF